MNRRRSCSAESIDMKASAGSGWKVRFIKDRPLSGAENMARDEYLLQTGIISGTETIYLRTYSFDPPCLSYGVLQRTNPDEEDKPCPAGVDMVRRPSGGRAVLHHHDITYCLVFPQSGSIFSGSVKESYLAVSRIIQKVLNRQELPVELSRIQGYGRHSGFDCFKSSTWSELLLDGRKIMGHAQFRRKGWCLQHGSLLLKKDPDLQRAIFGDDEEYPEITVDRERFSLNLAESIAYEAGGKIESDDFPVSDQVYLILLEKYLKTML
ncbi:MAG: lipoate--protein ligase family protein [Candidatus Wallbacteria bacterium]|nr:lipoate--protein ligase family protein [Candidatus Wallbacteria bacterium]